MRKILVTIPEGIVRDTFIPSETAAHLAGLGDVVWNDTGRQFTPEELAERLSGVEILVSGWGTPWYPDGALPHWMTRCLPERIR